MSTKTDCFAYRQGNFFGSDFEICDALDKLYCRKENCKFYKNKDTHKKDCIKRNDFNFMGC